MKFTPIQLEDNINVSKSHPLSELLWLVGGLILLVGLTFIVLGVTADWAVSKTPVKIETWMGKLALNQFPATESAALQQRLQPLLDQLPLDSPLRQYRFRIFLSETPEVNAIALPGGNIVVFSGLLQQVKSENELAMVLAHELGHFAHRDHMRSLGRGLGLAVATALLFGENNAASELASKALLSFQVRYSQAQESAADQFGLDLLTKRYGHAGGATDFFSRLAKDAGNKLPYILASHPHPQDRIEALQRHIKNQHYHLKKTLPLEEDLAEPQ
ncbi:Peptidase family M48 [Desulfuromusa kysingii]|uniref:Peptidase family M48 n=1 Tax=Desulfuromusa kysingii TaxID=37625 RepID=A0A1H4C9Z9_9BACT|nr:M48 family metallopeptidase [Desulfuromusa kysingii]SEA57204.1 Peptidase family M48 [Desulfuromusa kysingii]